MSRLLGRLMRTWRGLWCDWTTDATHVSEAWLTAQARHEDAAGIDGVCWQWAALQARDQKRRHQGTPV